MSIDSAQDLTSTDTAQDPTPPDVRVDEAAPGVPAPPTPSGCSGPRRAGSCRAWSSLPVIEAATLRKVEAQRATSFSNTRLRIARIRRCASRGEICTARMIAAFSPSVSCGLTSSALVSSRAAPVNSDSTSTPASSWRQAMYSLATRFIPSRSGVTSMTSAAR